MNSASDALADSRKVSALAWSFGIIVNLALLASIHQLTLTPERTADATSRMRPVEFVRLQASTPRQSQSDRTLPPPLPTHEAPAPPLPTTSPSPAAAAPTHAPAAVSSVIPAPAPRLSLTGLPYIGAASSDGTSRDGNGLGSGGQTGGGATPRPSSAVDEFEFNLTPTVRVAPLYPARALRERIEGVVTVDFSIEADGSVRDPVVLHASVPGVFDEAVLAAVRQWRFRPKYVAGRTASRRARQDVDFSLKDRD